MADKNAIVTGLESLSLDGSSVSHHNHHQSMPVSIVEDIFPRLLALQQQLEKLDAERYLLQHQRGEDPLAPLNSTANKTEISLQSLRKRLSEVRQQLYDGNGGATSAGTLAHLAKSYFGGMIRGGRGTVGKRHLLDGFPGEGEAFVEEDREIEEEEEEEEEEDAGRGVEGVVNAYEFEISEGEFFDDELMTGDLGPDSLLDATRLGLRLFGRETEESTTEGTGTTVGTVAADYELVTKAEAELEAALELVASPSLTNERKLEILREKFANVLKQDLQWRSRVNKATRLAHDERLQRQLIEMELDKANAIKHRLESLCRDLHNENRRIKAEKSLERQLESAAAVAAAEKEKEKEREVKGATIEFTLPGVLEKAALAKENSSLLADRIVSLADLFLCREQHFASLLRIKEIETLNAQEKANILADQLSKQTSLL